MRPWRPHVGYKSRDRGPLEFESRLRREEGDIMPLARKHVVTITPTTSIWEAARTMLRQGVRRLPVTDAGTKRLVGMLTTRDLLDFLGGGERHFLISQRFKGNFYAAVNEGVRAIMSERMVYGTKDMSIAEVTRLLLQTGVGGAPIVDEHMHVVGMVSERDFLSYIPPHTGTGVSYYMTRDVITTSPETQVRETMRKMVARGVRRLPIVAAGKLTGIITSVDILRYFGRGEMFERMRSGRVDEALTVGIDSIMTREVLTVTPETDLGEAAGLMVSRGFGGLPVVEDGVLVGIITERDMLELLA